MNAVSRTLIVTGALSMLVLGSTGAANAASNPAGSGQPGASCQDFQSSPTDPLLVNGFNTAGFAKAESVYAGSDGTASATHAQSSKAVSQYDVACYQLSQH